MALKHARSLHKLAGSIVFVKANGYTVPAAVSQSAVVQQPVPRVGVYTDHQNTCLVGYCNEPHVISHSGGGCAVIVTCSQAALGAAKD